MLPVMKQLIRSKKRPIVFDSFDRADSAVTLGNADTGQAWAVSAGTWGISGGQAYSVSDVSLDCALLNNPTADAIFSYSISGDIAASVGPGSYHIIHCIFRALNADTLLSVELFNGVVRLYKRATGSFTALANSAVPTVDGKLYSIDARCIGNAIVVSVDGIVRISHVLSGGNGVYAGYTNIGLLSLKGTTGGVPITPARCDGVEVRAI